MISAAEAHRSLKCRSVHFKGRYIIYNITPHNALNNTTNVEKDTTTMKSHTHNITKNEVNEYKWRYAH